MKVKTIITILLALRQRTEKANRKAEIRTKKMCLYVHKKVHKYLDV